MTGLTYLDGSEDAGKDSLVGAVAFDANGERLGTVEGLIVDERTRAPRYLVVKSTGWLRSNQFVVPVGLIERADSEEHSVALHTVTKGRLGSHDYPVYDERWWAADDGADFAAHERDLARSYDPGRDPNAPVDYEEPIYRTSSQVAAELQLLGERLNIRKERVQAGNVRITKRVTSRTETVEVPIREVYLVIECAAGDGTVEVDGRALADGETVEVPIYTERPRVSKESVIAERVTVRTQAMERMEHVAEEVKHEELVVDQSAEGLAIVVEGSDGASEVRSER
jgi:uncharacterized protein (TIGR02271 family)